MDNDYTFLLLCRESDEITEGLNSEIPKARDLPSGPNIMYVGILVFLTFRIDS